MNMYGVAIFGLAILFPAVLCGSIARLDKRPAGRWFLYGLFFGVFGMIFLVFYAKDDKQARIPRRMMLLQSVMWTLMLVGVYQTFNGYLVK